jgi:hypothetical protein
MGEQGGAAYGLETAVDEAGTKKHFLWSLASGRNTLYLLGSLHLLTRDSYPLDQVIQEAYEDSQSVVFEANMDALKDPLNQARIMALGFYPLDQTLRQNVSKRTYRTLEKRVKEAGLSMAVFDRLKPWACALTLTVLALQKLGFDQAHGIDAYFFHKAKRDGKKLVFLEEVKYQIDLLAGMGREEQELSLRQALDDLALVETMASEMVDAWERGDASKLHSIMSKSLRKYPRIHDRLLVERNKNWVARLEDLGNQEGNVLVIVGAAHLVGPGNLLDLLRERGHEVTQR